MDTIEEGRRLLEEADHRIVEVCERMPSSKPDEPPPATEEERRRRFEHYLEARARWQREEATVRDLSAAYDLKADAIEMMGPDLVGIADHFRAYAAAMRRDGTVYQPAFDD